MLTEFIRKLLGHKREYTSALSNLNDCIPILSREIFEEDKEKLKYLEDIKKEYSDILSKKRIVLSIDLNTSNLYEQMNMYIEMLHDLLDGEEVDNSFEKAFYYNDGTKKINMMIKMSKLKLYYRRIEKLAIEANVRRMALKEIFDEKLFFSSKKKNSIKEEMNHLAGTLLVYTNQIQTIKLQIDSYLMNYETLGNEEFIERDIETELLNRKQEELKQMIEAFMIEDKRDIENCDNDFLTIAFMEEALSKYIYEHKNVEVEKLREECAFLQQRMKTAPNLEPLLPQIEKLEMKVKALIFYEHNLIEKDDLCRLYGLKFLVITDNILIKQEQHLAEKCSFIELEHYGEIITNKISSLLQERNPYIEILAPEADYKIVVESIKKVLKNEDNEFSFVDILNDKKKLGLLLSIEKKNGIEKYFNMCMEPKEKYSSVNFHERILEFMPILPLATIYDMVYYNEKSSFDPLYEIYKIIKKKQKESTKFRFPYGLTKIDISYEDLLETEVQFIQKIRQLCQYKNIEFPTSLCELNGPFLEKMNVGGIRFHDGIRKISNGFFRKIKAESIYVPSSIEKVDADTFELASIKDIYFNNYKELKLDKKSKLYLIPTFFGVEKDEQNFIDYCYDHHKSWLDGSSDLSPVSIEYNIFPTFHSISFLNDTSSITIEKEELRMHSIGYDLSPIDVLNGYSERILCKIEEQIANKELEKKI